MPTFKDAVATSQLEPGRYLFKVSRLEDGNEGEYGPSIKWVFNVADMESKQAILDGNTGEPYEFWAYSSTKMGKTAKQVAKARAWTEALLNRNVEGESGDALAKEVIGKMAVAILGTDEKTGYTRILQLTPFVPGGKAAPQPEPVAAVTATAGAAADKGFIDPFMAG